MPLFQLPSNLEVEDSCNIIPSYLDPSTPLDKNARCASGFCRTSDNKCGCDDNDDCSSSELCHSDNKCYSSGLSIDDDQDCAAEDGTALNDRCASGICRSSDNKCGCTSTDHCDSDSGEVCHSGDNKCYVSGLSIGQDCSAFNGDDVDARCASGLCRSTDKTCGCTSNDHCPSDQVCYSGENGDNKCYSLPSIVSSSTSCDAISGVESNGSAGDLIAAQNGNLILINSDGIITDVSAQFARDVTTTFENINNFYIASDQTVNVLGTMIVKSKHTQIDGTLNGSGGGYVGGVRRTSNGQSGRKNGSGPGSGKGGWKYTGGAGAGHGKLIISCAFTRLEI